MFDPDRWTAEQWAAHDAALARLLDPRMDKVVRDLDACGWKIVPADGGPEKWPMSTTRACPDWATPLTLRDPRDSE
jgi:hypothetical protein